MVMYATCIVLLCLLPTTSGQTNLQALSPRRDPFLFTLEAEVKKVLREVLTGPTKGHEVTLLVEDEVEEIIDVDHIVSSLSIPILLLHPPQDIFEEQLEPQDIPAVASTCHAKGDKGDKES